MSDEDDVQLSSAALSALAEFRAEKERKDVGDAVSEDWQLSQFWYDDETAKKLVREAVVGIEKGTVRRIACVSSPTLVKFLHQTEEYKDGRIKVTVFEYDTRFDAKFPGEFVFYDYKQPTNVPEDFKGIFDVIIADPPFLAAECLIKTSHTIRLIGRDDAKIILCTGAIMEELAGRLLSLHRTAFEPHHANNLANDFACFANYQTVTL